MWETWVRSLGWEDPCRRKRLPTPVFWPGEFHRQRSMTGYIVHGVAKSYNWATFTSFHFPYPHYYVYSFPFSHLSLWCHEISSPSRWKPRGLQSYFLIQSIHKLYWLHLQNVLQPILTISTFLKQWLPLHKNYTESLLIHPLSHRAPWRSPYTQELKEPF